jgi:hypothetical protein
MFATRTALDPSMDPDSFISGGPIMKRLLMLSVLVSGLLLSTVSTAEATHTDTFGAEIVTVVQAYPVNSVLPPSPISPVISLGSSVSYYAYTCNAGLYSIACEGLSLR